MEQHPNQYLNDEELLAFIDNLFPNGIIGDDVLQQIGSRRKPKPLSSLLCFPDFTTWLPRSWQAKIDAALAQTQLPHQNWTETYIVEEERLRVALRIAQCLWDVFSDNNEVITANGCHLNYWTFRIWSRFWNEQISKTIDDWREGRYCYFQFGDYRYSDIYDLDQIYRMIFQRLKAQGADWIYSPPQIFGITVGAAAEALSASESGQDLPPAKQQLVEKIRAFNQGLQEMNTMLWDTLNSTPPPQTLAAYQLVFGRNPQGWPLP